MTFRALFACVLFVCMGVPLSLSLPTLSAQEHTHNASSVEALAPTWTFETGGERVLDFWDHYLSDPLVHGDLVVFGSGDGTVYALDRGSGDLRWSHVTTEVVHAAPVAGDGLIYIGGFDSILYALRVKTGEVAWTIPVFTRVFGTAVPVGDDVVFGGFNGKLMGVDPVSGAVRWTYQTPASLALFEAVFDEEGRLTEGMRTLYQDGRGREAEERLLQMGSIAATPAVRGTMVYFGTTEGVLYALDAAAFAG